MATFSIVLCLDDAVREYTPSPFRTICAGRPDGAAKD
jgi:hypothetical protein